MAKSPSEKKKKKNKKKQPTPTKFSELANKLIRDAVERGVLKSTKLEDVSKKATISKTYLWQIINGVTTPKKEVIDSLASGLELSQFEAALLHLHAGYRSRSPYSLSKNAGDFTRNHEVFSNYLFNKELGQIRYSCPDAIPGVFQTEQYQRCIMKQWDGSQFAASTQDIQDFIKAHAISRDVFYKNTPETEIILSDSHLATNFLSLEDRIEQISFLLRDLQSTYLFKIALKYQHDLEARNITKELNQEFENNNITLSDKLSVKAEKNRDIWWIMEERKPKEQGYRIEKVGDNLFVYQNIEPDFLEVRLINPSRFHILPRLHIYGEEHITLYATDVTCELISPIHEPELYEMLKSLFRLIWKNAMDKNASIRKLEEIKYRLEAQKREEELSGAKDSLLDKQMADLKHKMKTKKDYRLILKEIKKISKLLD